MLGRFSKSWLAVLASTPALPTSGRASPATRTPATALTTRASTTLPTRPPAPAAPTRAMTERERRALLRRRPNVTSWRRLLETARDDYEHAIDPTLSVAAG